MTFDIEKRVLELIPNTCPPGECGPWCKPHTTESVRKAAIQLAREAADAEREKWQQAERELSDAYLRLRQLIPGAMDAEAHEAHVWGYTERCLRRLLGAADARAEEIAAQFKALADESGGRMDDYWLRRMQGIARSTITKPKSPFISDLMPKASKIKDAFKEVFMPTKAEWTMTQEEILAHPLRVSPDGTLSGTLPCGHDVMHVGGGYCPRQPGVEADSHCRMCCSDSLTKPKPETREHRLEAALREIAAGDHLTEEQLRSDARRALEEK